jgi:acyl carrier protein|tara:strand:+ start:1301 stop:1531 length:231 start_codon:yes stop_codon:yes gene_type:complete
MSRDTVIQVLKEQFGDRDYQDDVHIIDDLDGDEFSLVELSVKIDELLDISLDEVKILEVGTVGDLIALVDSHVQSD